jgi:hypothetical protein
MMRDVGVRYPQGQKLNLDEKNALRQECDIRERTKILKTLNAHQVRFSETDLLVLAQPDFEEPDLYWKSIEDLLDFAVAVAAKRRPVSGKTLLELLEEAKSSIMKIVDFSNPSIPFEKRSEFNSDRCR